MDSISDQKDSFQKAAEKMAEFWTSLLKKGAADSLVERWGSGKRRISEHQFEIELMQASSAARNENTYSDDELETFRKTLEALIVEREINDIKMKYHPDDVLVDAGEAADLHIGMTTFPMDTSIYYSSSGEYLDTFHGRGAGRQRIYLNPEENPPVYGFLLYQLSENGPLKAIQMNEWELPTTSEKERDRIVSKAENIPPHTVSITYCYGTSADKAISHVQEYGRYKYEPPADVATRALEEIVAPYDGTIEDVNQLIGNGARPSALALCHAISSFNAPVANRLVALGVDFNESVRFSKGRSSRDRDQSPADMYRNIRNKSTDSRFSADTRGRMQEFIGSFTPPEAAP